MKELISRDKKYISPIETKISFHADDLDEEY